MSRSEIINKLIQIYGYKSYLEIGVDNPILNFNKIKCDEKTGVDPNPKSNATFINTSDVFFKSNNKKYDLIFIDGLHEYKQVIEDINNSLNCLNDNGTIVVHDCNPTSKEMQAVPRIQGEWTGDVWRAWIYFRAKDEIQTSVLNTDYGVGIIRKGKNKNLLIGINHEEISYEYFAENKIELLNLISINPDPVSICVPAFEQYGLGGLTLKKLFESVKSQTFKDFEVVLADNANDNSIFNVYSFYRKLFNIEYHKNATRGTSFNSNYCLDHAKYNNIKIMYQDDLLINPEALADISFALKFDNWLACAGYSIDRNDRIVKERAPFYSDLIMKGQNTLGMPSIIAHKKNDNIRFDVKLKTMLDCDYYHQLFTEYGNPGLIKKKLIGSRYWQASTSAKQPNYIKPELKYLATKYPDFYAEANH